MYSIQRLGAVRTDNLRRFFSDLPLDPFLKEKCRFRRFSRYAIEAPNLARLGHKVFVQSIKHNKLLGAVERDYMELDESLSATEDFRNLIFSFVEACHAPPAESEIGVHQIRIASTLEIAGKPSPEGIHEDGFDYVGIFCADRYNVSGGETCLYRPGEAEPLYCHMLEPGELLVFDDKRLMHCTSPIYALSSEGGVRDVFILTLSGRSC